MPFELPLLFLPFIAAVIGYFTNWVAIKMLFRPLTEKRIWGFRIPFTPGVIPRKRTEIAQNIGQAVSENLLTSQAVKARLGSQEVRAKIDITVYNWMEDLLGRRWGSIKELVPDKLSEEWLEIVASAEAVVVNALVRFVQSQEAEEITQDVVFNFLSGLSEQRLEELVDEETRAMMRELLDSLLEEVAADEKLAGEIRGFWKLRIDKLFEEEGKLQDYISPEMRDLLYEKLEEWLPILVVKLARLLEDPQIRKQIKMHLFDLIDDLLEREFEQDSVWDQFKRGMLETFVISTEKLKLRIDQAVDESVPKLAELLQQPEVKRKINQALIERLNKVLQKDLSEFDVSDQRREQLADELTSLTVALIRNERVRDGILASLTEAFRSLEDKRIGDFLPEARASSLEYFSTRLSSFFLTLLRSGDLEEQFSEYVSQFSARLREAEIGPLGNLVDDKWLNPIKDYGVELSIDFLRRETPKILNTIDISSLVEKEVEQFSLEEVEGLILDVTGNQLRAITWFGAVIGFLIGLVQIAVLYII
ncbi:MAG: DUF445 family protein [Candidatus Acetothermia bacterium]